MIIAVFVLSLLLCGAIVVIIAGLDREAKLSKLARQSTSEACDMLEQNVALRFALRESNARGAELAGVLAEQQEENRELVHWIGHLTSDHAVILFKPRPNGVGPN